MIRLALLALALHGCTGTLPVMLISQVDDGEERVLDACSFWSLDCVLVDDHHGALTVLLTDNNATSAEDGEVGGSTFDDALCSPVVWAVDDGLALEHEVGHVAGLRHVDDVGNVMTADMPFIASATEDQMAAVERRADSLSRCIGGRP